MLEELKAYYRSRGIAATGFRCRHLPDCSRGAGDFIEAREAMVGDLYVERTLPRLLFLSLDPATDCCGRGPRDRSTDAVTRWECAQQHPVEGSPTFRKQSHWYKTHTMAYSILTPIARHRGEQEPKFSEMHRYFAHVNSAKCKDAAKGTAQGAARIFRNCREYVPGELEVLRPDFVIAQGKPAREALDGLSIVCSGTDGSGRYESSVIRLGAHEAVKFETHHPNRKDDSYRNEVRDGWPWYLRVAMTFCESGTSGLIRELGFGEA